MVPFIKSAVIRLGVVYRP